MCYPAIQEKEKAMRRWNRGFLLTLAMLLAFGTSAMAQTATIQNSSAGTKQNQLVVLVLKGTAAAAQQAATTDTSGVIGICQQFCGTGGSAKIATSGIAQCFFDGAVTTGDYVQASTATNSGGKCHDAGGTYPGSGQILGRVLATNTNAAGGTYPMILVSEVDGGSVGGVTSVAQTVPTGEFSIAGSPITSTGTLAITKHTIAANLIASGPTSGADAAWTFRALNGADTQGVSDTLLAHNATVDLSTSTPPTLYTCPTGKSCVITKIVVSAANASLATWSGSFGWESTTFANVIANATHTELTGATLYTVLSAKTGAAIGTSTGTLKVKNNTTQSSATASMDVFGYTY
jgi:hypothetical protein